MYATRLSSDLRLSGTFESRTLTQAVRQISENLVRRSCLNTRDRQYAGLLSDIVGQSHYATIEILASKRRQSAESLARKRRDHHHSTPTSDAAHLISTTTSTTDIKATSDEYENDQLKARMRDKLVKLLYTNRIDDISTRERTCTIKLLHRDGPCDVEGLRRLWGIPKVVFETTKLDRYFLDENKTNVKSILLFYDEIIFTNNSDSRIFNILYWKESCYDKKHSETHDGSTLAPSLNLQENDGDFTNTNNSIYKKRYLNDSKVFRTVSKGIVAKVIKVLLSRRKKPLFERNMDVVIETVMYSINPDRFVERFRENTLRDAGFFKGLHGYEYSRNFSGSLENLQMGKFNRMVKEIRSLHSSNHPSLNNNMHIYGNANASSNSNGADTQANYVSLRTVRRYCSERDLLTDRALRRIYERYVRNKSSSSARRHPHPQRSHSQNHNSNTNGNSNSHSPRQSQRHVQFEDMRFSISDFVRMYLAWVECATDAGVRYWFSILDQDGDGIIGMKDIMHFYKERKLESERRNGMLLADVGCVWIKICAMGGRPPTGPGLDLQSMLDLGKDEREFIIHALLVRRADDGHLTNVQATMQAHSDSDPGSAIII